MVQRFSIFKHRRLIISAIIGVFVISGNRSMAQALSRKDADEIRVLAREKIKGLNDLLNAISNDDLSNYERRYLMMNSYMPSTDQLFFNDGVIVEDDTDPKQITSAPGLDTPIEKYLSNFDLFYSKSEANTVEFTNIVVSDVKVDKYAFVKVFFTEQFKGKNNTSKMSYQPVPRVAELRADKVGSDWIVYLTHIAFNSAENAKAAPVTPVASSTYESAQKNKDQPVASRPSDKKPAAATPQDKEDGDRVFKEINKPSSAEAQQARKLGTIKLGVGIAGLAFGAVTYAMLNKDFKDYKSKISNPEGLTSYAKPGIYISVGAAAVGLGVSLTSLLDFKRAKGR